MPHRPSRDDSDSPRAPRARFAALLLTAALFVLGAAGCGDGSSTESSATSAGTPAPGVGETKPLAPVGGATDTSRPKNAAGAQQEQEILKGHQPRVDSRDAIAQAIVAFFTSANPDLVCDRYATETLIKDNYGDEAGCLNGTVPATAAETVQFGPVTFAKGGATVQVTPKGGVSDGETIKVELVQNMGIWQIDSLRSNAPVGP